MIDGFFFKLGIGAFTFAFGKSGMYSQSSITLFSTNQHPYRLNQHIQEKQRPGQPDEFIIEYRWRTEVAHMVIQHPPFVSGIVLG